MKVLLKSLIKNKVVLLINLEMFLSPNKVLLRMIVIICNLLIIKSIIYWIVVRYIWKFKINFFKDNGMTEEEAFYKT